MVAHNAHAKHSVRLDKMLGVKKVELNGRERDLNLREVALAEAQTQLYNPWDNCEELMGSLSSGGFFKTSRQTASWRRDDCRPW
jgi:hypothetical protein